MNKISSALSSCTLPEVLTTFPLEVSFSPLLFKQIQLFYVYVSSEIKGINFLFKMERGSVYVDG